LRYTCGKFFYYEQRVYVAMPKVIQILVAVPEQDAGRYFKHLRQQDDFEVRIVTSTKDAFYDLRDKDMHTDVLVDRKSVV